MTEHDATPDYKVTVINRLLSVEEAATVLNVSKSWLDKKRLFGGGPVFVRIGTRINYELDDLVGWINEHKASSTSEKRQA